MKKEMEMKKPKEFIKRQSILECLDFHINRNLYCERKVLTNEATVEDFFVNRLLEDFGFKDTHIKPKKSINELTIGRGSKKENYKPDYVLVIDEKPKICIDAKDPKERVDDYIYQTSGYSLALNQKYRDENPVKFFILTNGVVFKLFKWDDEKPLMELTFEDFYVGNKKYEKLRDIISLEGLLTTKGEEGKKERFATLKKISKETAQKRFINCHKYIWNSENYGPLPAFTEFVKLVFLKLWNDRILHENYQQKDSDGNLKVPATANTFSVEWIESRERNMKMGLISDEDVPINPINDIQFKNLLQHIQGDIDKKKKKRIFDVDEKIKLKSTTIKGVVKKLEKIDLFGIDEDMNGRLFEVFLNSTMRGEALGQYFTPRGIVLLGVLLADLKISKNHIDKVLDGSCGTGGFLIEALTLMRNIVRKNESYSKQEKEELIAEMSNNCLYGIDAASEPNLARIARINMYLHGDGGSHIYFYDGLKKTIEVDKSDDHELQLEIEDMKENIKHNSFDVVLTNPPFSMWYEMTNEAQAKVLGGYKLMEIEGTNDKRNRLRGSALFIERYYELLKPEGKLSTIIDETVLSSPQYDYVRNFIREYFIIRAIISLHGDAFQMAKSRVKTALVYLEKKKNITDEQPSVFMYSSVCLSVDDMPVTTSPSKVEEARELAKQEIDEILKQFERYKNGEKDIWLVPHERLKDRLDVKYCIPLQGRFINKWKDGGYEVIPLHVVCDLREEIILPNEYPSTKFRILTIMYSGRCKTEETRLGKNINYRKMKIVRKGDLVFSEYNTCHGAIGYITEEFDGALASGSYTVVRCFKDYDSLYLWSILRTTEIRADFLTSAIGMGRQTIGWEDIKNVEVPFVSIEKRKEISKDIIDSWEAEKAAQEKMEKINLLLNENFCVESKESKERFEATKPPK
jgi:type I restriction enzyme M protein